MNNYFDWSPQTVARLLDLWSLGHSTAVIGWHLGCSKNAVVGKVHRLELIARPSPIVRGTRKAAKPKRQPIALPSFPIHAPLPPIMLAPFISQPVDLPPVLASFVAAPVSGSCCWPMWGHDQCPTQEFCGARRFKFDSSYCGAHHRKAYTGVPAGLFADRAA